MSDLLPIGEMYSQVYRLNTSGVDGYDCEKKYVDPLRQIKERQYLTIKKGQKSNRHVTERGSYLKDHVKLTKTNPGPGQYKDEQLWSKQSKSLKNPTKKKTYLDEIIEIAKKEKIPAPGQYNLFKSQKQIDAYNKKLSQKKVNPQTKINYLDEVQYASNCVPGPGSYNPRQIKNRLKTREVKPEEWRKKSQLQEKKKPPKNPDMGTYNPQPSFHLFSSPSVQRKTLKTVWGTEQRFDLSNDKGKKEKTKSLGPGQYQLLHNWRGKNDKRPARERDCFEATSKPLSKSVYY